MKFGFYVSGNAERLKQYLRQRFEIERIAFVLIDSVDNKELALQCAAFEIPYHPYSYSELGLKYKEQNSFISAKLLELLEKTNSDYCFIFGGRILEGDLLRRYENRLINFHPSLLPSFKGVHAIDQALQNHALLLGNSAHFIDEKVDNGAVIMQSILPAQQFKNYNSVLDLQVPMLKQIIIWLKDNRITIHQGKIVVENAKYQVDTFIPNLEIEMT